MLIETEFQAFHPMKILRFLRFATLKDVFRAIYELGLSLKLNEKKKSSKEACLRWRERFLIYKTTEVVWEKDNILA